MKTLVCLALAASAFASPALSFAQSASAPLTRAEVRAHLIQLEQAGYDPTDVGPYYPANIQAAEAKVAAQNDKQQTAQAVGGVAQMGAFPADASAHGVPGS
jgi:hypothetical protein